MTKKKCTTFIEWGGQKTALLSRTEAMDCWSFSLPAGKDGACPLAVIGENSICGACYAMTGRYNMPNVLRAQKIRFLWLKNSLKNRVATYQATDLFTESIRDHSIEEGYFRWFDSGDFFHPKLIQLCINVCESLPEIKFWFPTRVWHARSDSWQVPLKALGSLSNVKVRPSALYINDPPISGFSLMPGTSVFNTVADVPSGVSVCPKTLHGGSCVDNSCRSCWDSDQQIGYLYHGFGSSSKYTQISVSLMNKRRSFLNEQISGS